MESAGVVELLLGLQFDGLGPVVVSEFFERHRDLATVRGRRGARREHGILRCARPTRGMRAAAASPRRIGYLRAMGGVRVGIVGSGFLAETRARCWKRVRGAAVAGVASRTPESAASFAAAHDLPVTFEAPADLFRSDAIDVVDLCVPNRWHRSLAEAAASAGKHVICTKPLTAYVGQDLGEAADPAGVGARDRRAMYAAAVADARAMTAACDDAGVRLLYAENWLHAPGFVRAASLLERADAAILEMRGWECHSGSHSRYAKQWAQTGGGALLRLAAHPLGAMLWLKRAEGLRRDGTAIVPVAVAAEVADLTQVRGADARNTRIATGWEDVENWGCAMVGFSDGSRATAIGSDNTLGGMESRLELYGSNCQLKCNLSPNDLVRAYAPDAAVFGDAVLQEKLDTGAGWSTPMADEDWTSGQQPMLQSFADALAGGEAVAGDGALGTDVTRVLYAAYVSAAEGGRVTLEQLDRLP